MGARFALKRDPLKHLVHHLTRHRTWPLVLLTDSFKGSENRPDRTRKDEATCLITGVVDPSPFVNIKEQMDPSSNSTNLGMIPHRTAVGLSHPVHVGKLEHL